MSNLTIWKYPFSIAYAFMLEMPKGAVVICVQVQAGVPTLWAEVNPSNQTEYVRFRIVGTGHLLPLGQYLGTFQQPPFVWHLYQVG